MLLRRGTAGTGICRGRGGDLRNLFDMYFLPLIE
jgi:hypothetical protein